MTDSIFNPHFNINPEIEDDLRDIERRRWLIDHMLLMPRHEAWLRREIQVRRASGTTRIEGANLDESAVSRLMAQGAGANPTEDEQANLNALGAYEFIDFLSDQHDLPTDELVIREVNRRFIEGTSEMLTPGAAEALAVKTYRLSRTKGLGPVESLAACLEGYQLPVPRDVMDFQIGLAVREATDLDFVPEKLRPR